MDFNYGNSAQHVLPQQQKGYYDKEELKEEFLAIVKNDKESNEIFLKRIESKANELDREGISLKPHVKAFTLLKGLRAECLKTPIISIMQDEGNGDYAEWIKDGDMKHTLNKAESRMKFERAATAMLCPKAINTYPSSFKKCTSTRKSTTYHNKDNHISSDRSSHTADSITERMWNSTIKN